ncbi:MAG TPA: CocE/NonD family hydrolase [Silvibacterium sp.]|nr:CocE/NonD family hydrolase [Silvibacterium sp.]
MFCRLPFRAAFLASLLALLSVANAQSSNSSQAAAANHDTAALDRYVGQYRYVEEPEIIVSVFRDGDHLVIESARSPRQELIAEPADGFVVKETPQHLIFTTDDAGKVTGIKRKVGSTEMLLERVGDQPVHNHFRPYSRQEVMIPMRDGVKLHAIILRPTDTSEPLPFLMQRTPYGVDGSDSDSINARNTELAQSGYIFVMEDIRGRYESQGQFVMMRPIAAHHDPKSADLGQIDESTDTYDTVDWLIKNIPNNNGRVGVVGVSYPGFLAAEAAIDPHPAVKAVSPQAPMTDVWIGDDFFHNGAFRQTYGYDYVLGMESSKQATFTKLNEDAYTYFLNAGSFAAAGKKSGTSSLPTWQGFLDHPNYDEFWHARAVQPHLTQVTVPTLEVGGWWDQEDMWGPQAEYAALESHNASRKVFLVLGPWNHGQWGLTTRHLGSVDFGAPIGDQFRKQIEAPFFAYYLKDQSGFNLEDTASFQTGTNQWMRYSHWPPKNSSERDLYLGANRALSFEKPAKDKAFTAYTSDPANPIPYRKRPIEATYAPTGSGWRTWLVEDQRPYSERKDVATWSTPVLDHDLTVTGDIVADLHASTSGTDSDWIVKLIDVYPDDPSLGKMSGRQLMIADEIFRGRYRNNPEHPEAIPANQTEEYKFSLHGADHVFLKGHRVMVQVQSSWFPLYDRNPQTFVPNIMTAQPTDYKPAEQRIYADSHIELPVPEHK